MLEKIGQHAQDTRELAFTDMRVPLGNLLGSESSDGAGFAQLMRQLPQERLAIAVTAVSVAEQAVRVTVDYAKERTAFGQDLMGFQNTRFVLAECASDARRANSSGSLHPGAPGRPVGRGRGVDGEVLVHQKQCEVVDRCLQVFGGYGYMLEYPIARMYASSRVQKIYGGTNEAMTELIARSL